LPILITNCTLIIQGMVNPGKVPSVGDNVPLIVLTESMEPDIKGGDLIICHPVDPQTLKEGDVIAFFDPKGNGTSIVTHKIHEVFRDEETGKITEFKTYGINNFNAKGEQSYDKVNVPVDDVVGIYTGERVPVIGSIAMFMQSTWGLILCIFLPLACFIAYDLVMRKKKDAGKQSDMDALRAELEALKAAQANAGEAQPTEGENNTVHTSAENADDEKSE